jgi:hypothetical protein
MNAYAVAVFVSIVVYVIVGNYAGRKVKHLEDYFVAGRQAPTLLIVGTLVASFMSTNAFLAETGMAYGGYGMLLLIVTGINSLGYVIGALFFGRFLRRSRAMTVAEYFGKRFDDRRVQLVAGITIIDGGDSGRRTDPQSDHDRALWRRIVPGLGGLHIFHVLLRITRRHHYRHDHVPALQRRRLCRARVYY